MRSSFLETAYGGSCSKHRQERPPTCASHRWIEGDEFSYLIPAERAHTAGSTRARSVPPTGTQGESRQSCKDYVRFPCCLVAWLAPRSFMPRSTACLIERVRDLLTLGRAPYSHRCVGRRTAGAARRRVQQTCFAKVICTLSHTPTHSHTPTQSSRLSHCTHM